MKKTAGLAYALFVLGAALVYFIFTLIFGDLALATPKIWLALGVIYVNYVLLFLNLPLLFGRPESFSLRIPALAISAIAFSSYAILSIGLAIASLFINFRFEYELAAQFVLFFILLVRGLSAAIAGEKVAEVQAAESASLGSVRSFKDEGALLAAEIRSKAFLGDQKKSLESLAEKMRFISPVNTDEARELDSTIASLAGSLRRLLAQCSDESSFSSSRKDVQGTAEELASLVERRKLLRN